MPALNDTVNMPVLFIGHGSPMNAVEENEFVQGWRNAAKYLPRPVSILCISAHWETKGVFVTAMKEPRTIHDFSGFPAGLSAVKYPAPGSPELAETIGSLIRNAQTGLDYHWGLDHGSWSVLSRMYPDAQIPVVQLSLDSSKPAKFHYELARELAPLRQQGVLILCSGNMVHNLRLVDWRRMKEPVFGYEWAIEACEKMKTYIHSNDHHSLIDYQAQGKAFELAIPTPEHYLPLLYLLGLQEQNETVEFFNDKPVMGSLSMTSLILHPPH